MKTLSRLTIVISIICTFVTSSFAAGTYSGQAVKEGSASASHASNSVACSVVAGSQVVSAVVAIPLMAVGASGAAANHIGEDLWEAATTEPLEISDEIITAGPAPDEALNL